MTSWSSDMVFCLCATRNMYPQLCTSIAMLLTTQPKPIKIYAFVEDNYMSSAMESVEFIDVFNYKPLVNNNVNTGNWATYMTMTRCYFCDLLPNEDKVIYLDLDVMIEDDVSEFWNIDLQGKEVAGVVDTKFYQVHEVPYITNIDNYVNAGVLLMDLKRMRENGTDKKMVTLLHTKPMYYLDQDCINLACDVLPVDCRYNSGYATTVSDNPLIHHVIQKKPWAFDSKWHRKWFDIYDKYVMVE